MALDTAVLFSHAQKTPDAIALDDLSQRRTWYELADRSCRVAHLLREDLGLARDDHAAALMSNRVEYFELVLGAFLAGIWLTPINHHLTEEEVDYIVRDSGAKVLFTDDRFEEIAHATAAPLRLLAGAELDDALAAASNAALPLSGPVGGTMVYTSGTTGRPKGVMRTRAPDLAAGLAAWRGAGTSIGLDGQGPHLVTGPLYHAAPLLFAIYDQLNGASVVIMPRWDERQALQLMRERAIAHAHLVPTMFVRLLNLPEADRAAFDPSELRLVLHGAAPISEKTKRRMIDWWGPVLVEYWGGTEGGVNTLVDSQQWLEHPATVGRSLPRFEVFAADEEGNPLPAGEVGLLHCRHNEVPVVFEYHNAPEKTAAAHPAPHVFSIGDVGRVEADGYVYLSDRQSNMIISGGVNIYPAEIEQVLLEHPAIGDVGVFGIPDDEWGESVKAAVELREGYAPSADLETAILAYSRQHLAGYKVPRSIDFEPTLPRTPAGKLYVRRLRDRYWQGRDRQI